MCLPALEEHVAALRAICFLLLRVCLYFILITMTASNRSAVKYDDAKCDDVPAVRFVNFSWAAVIHDDLPHMYNRKYLVERSLTRRFQLHTMRCEKY